MSGYMSFVQLPGYPYPPQPPPPGMVYPGPPPPGLAANAYGYAPGHGHVNNQFLPLLPRPPPGTPTIPKLEKNDDELSLMLKKTLVVETMRDLATNGGLAIEAELKFAIEITLAQHQLPFQEPSANAPSQLRHMYSIFDGYRGFCRSNQVATLPLSPALVSIFLQPQLPQVRKIAYESFELYRQATSPVFYHYSTSPFIVKHNLSQSTFAMWMQAVAESHESLSSFRCLRDMAAPASASALPRIPKLEPGTRPRTGQLPAIAPAQPSTAISSAKLDLIKTNYQNTVAKGVVSTATSEGNVAPQKPPRPPRKRAKKPPPTLGTQEEEEAEEVEFMAAIEGFQKACAEYKVLKEQQEQAQEEAEPSEETLSVSAEAGSSQALHSKPSRSPGPSLHAQRINKLRKSTSGHMFPFSNPPSTASSVNSRASTPAKLANKTPAVLGTPSPSSSRLSPRGERDVSEASGFTASRASTPANTVPTKAPSMVKTSSAASSSRRSPRVEFHVEVPLAPLASNGKRATIANSPAKPRPSAATAATSSSSTAPKPPVSVAPKSSAPASSTKQFPRPAPRPPPRVASERQAVTSGARPSASNASTTSKALPSSSKPRQSSGLASPPLSEDPRRRSASNPAASGSTTTTSKKRTQEEEPVWKAAKKVQRVVEVVIPKPKAGTVVERSPPATKIVDLTESDGASSPRPSYHSPSSMATVTYNNGLYTPDYGEEASSTAAAVVASTTAPAWEQATTSYAAATLATSSSAAVVYTPATSASRATTTTRAAVVSSTTAQWQATTTSSSPAYSYSFAAIASTSSTTPAAASSSTSPASSSSSASSSAVNRSTTLTRPTVLATHAANSASSNSSSSSFKIVYLIPVFVILPLAVAFAAFCCYRSRKRSRSDKSWSAGSRSDGVLSPDEEKALVEGRFVTDGGDYDEKRGGGGKWSPRRNNDKQPRWSFVPQPLMRVISHSSDGHEGHSHEPQVDDVNFAAVPYNSLETPFIPPSKSQASIAQKRYLTPEEEEAQRLERGWGWGTQNRGLEPRRVARSASRSGSIVEGLSEGWKWASKKYKARSGGSHGSRRSGRTLGGDETSPSIYSPTVEGPYDGLEGEDAAEREAELDRLLAESRTGDSDLAKRFLSGRVTAADFPSTASVFAAEAQRQKQEQQGPVDNLTATPPRLPLRDPSRKASGAKPPPFALPTAPGQTHVSPKKSAIIRSTQSRNITPTKPGSGALIFAYDSPTRSTYTAPAPSAVIPANFRGIAPPPRSNTSTPIPRTSTATPVDPALLFSPPVGSVGSPMPAFEPGALKASESAFSLTGVVFAGEQTGPNALKQYANSRSREGSRERAEQTEKLRASAPSFSGAIAARAPTESKMSSRPHQPQAQPQPTASTLRPAKRESLGFNFAEPNLPRPLSHPSRVKSAVETLEARKNSTPPSPSTAVFPSSSQPRSTSPTKTTLTSTTPVKKYERPLGSGSAERSRVVSRSASSGTTSSTKLVAPPSSQKLSRSTTTREKEVDSDEEDTRNVGSLLLRRSRTSVHLGVLPPDSPTLSEIHGSGSGTASGGTSRSGHSSYSHSQSMSALASDANVFGHDDAPKPRRGPLPNAPVKRAVSGPRAMMQPPRGVSTAKATDPDSPSRNILGVSGGAGVSGGSGLEAMLRRSQAPELKSAMKK